MKVRFVEACTIYPDGKLPVEITDADVQSESVKEYPAEYAKLLISKGHAQAVEEPARARKTEEQA